MRAFFGIIATLVMLASVGCTTKNVGDALVTESICVNRGDYWIDDVNGCLSQDKVIKWTNSACFCETYRECQARGFPEYDPKEPGCDPETYEWVDER